MATRAANDPVPIALARQSKQQLLEELRQCRQRCLDQETTIDTFRRLFAAVIMKHGTLQTLHIDRKDMEKAGSGHLRVQEMKTGIVLALKLEGQPSPIHRPRLIT